MEEAWKMAEELSFPGFGASPYAILAELLLLMRELRWTGALCSSGGENLARYA